MPTFDIIWTRTAQPIEDSAEEAATIKAAQAGDQEAIMRLFAAYLPALCGAVRHYTSASLPVDDARQAAALGFLDCIARHDASVSDRLAGMVKTRVHDALGQAVSDATGGFTVPPRTLRRFFGILREAGGDIAEAVKLAPVYEMSTEAFLSVLAAVKADDSLDLEIETNGGADAMPIAKEISAPREITDAEDRVLVEVAFRAVEGRERDVCRLAYGFADYNPLHDGEIGDRLGFSRMSAQRIRNSGLRKMRKALCV